MFYNVCIGLKGLKVYLVEYDIIVSFGSFQLQVKGFCIGLFTSCHAKKIVNSRKITQTAAFICLVK